jgi:hypothetical protein
MRNSMSNGINYCASWAVANDGRTARSTMIARSLSTPGHVPDVLWFGYVIEP